MLMVSFFAGKVLAFLADRCRFRGAGKAEGVYRRVPVFGRETIDF